MDHSLSTNDYDDDGDGNNNITNQQQLHSFWQILFNLLFFEITKSTFDQIQCGGGGVGGNGELHTFIVYSCIWLNEQRDWLE